MVALGICLSACNNNNEPPMEVNLLINEQFVASNITFSKADTEYKEELRPWYNKRVVVNSADEIPDDPFGFAQSFYKINYKNNTLLLCYLMHDYNVVSVTNRYYKNNVENTYNWIVSLGVSGLINEDESGDKLILSRYAILVPKLPADANVQVWHGLLDHNWDWSKE